MNNWVQQGLRLDVFQFLTEAPLIGSIWYVYVGDIVYHRTGQNNRSMNR
jgi:hypothetical protein